MLKRLTITNLAIIENIDVLFKEGFTVLTGGTGAGKSLIIDSLSLLLGARASTELIRSGEEKAVIRGEFFLKNNRLEAILGEIGVTLEDGLIMVERTIGRSKSVVKINGVPVSLSDLNRVAIYLADIHSQFDFEKILDPEHYLEMIDGFSYEKISSCKNEYTSLLSSYREKKKELDDLYAFKRKMEENHDFYEYQFNELKAFGLEEGEEERIDQELSLLKNYDKVYSLAQQADSIIREDFLDRLYELGKTLEKLSEYQNQYKGSAETISDRYYELDDLFSSLKKDFKNVDYDPSRLNELEQRDYDLQNLKRKYRKSFDELIAYQNELARMLATTNNIDGEIASKEKEVQDSLFSCYEKGKELSSLRKENGKTIEKELKKNLDDLLLAARFEIFFRPFPDKADASYLKEDGLDEVDFLIETNIGEGLKSLAKIVSGGEASRIMLAFKTIFIKANHIATVIFDEIDTGISGEAAMAVANKIREIAKDSQVLAITHLPQVASSSDHHILISKAVTEGRTYASIRELSLEEKIIEVAQLISGNEVTEKQIAYAREMVLSSSK